MVEPLEDDLVLKYRISYQVGTTLEYTLTKEGLQTRYRTDFSKARNSPPEQETEQIDMEKFWDQFSPMIDKVIQDTQKGFNNMRTVANRTCLPFYNFFVRNRDGVVGHVRIYGRIEAGIKLEKGGNYSTLPDEYVALHELMKYPPSAQKAVNPNAPAPPVMPRDQTSSRSCSSM